MEHRGLFADMTNNFIATIFTDFMTRYAMLEELANAGEGLLRGYYQELETFNGIPLSKVSTVVDDVIKANYTKRLNEYVDANYSYHNDIVQSTCKLSFCKRGLEDLLLKAKVILDELEILKNNGNDSMDKYFSDFGYFKDAKENESQLVQEDAYDIAPEVSVFILMNNIYNMLNLEFTIQEKIIGALGPMTPSSELESYCMMWELRPYVKSDVINLAWKYVLVHKVPV